MPLKNTALWTPIQDLTENRKACQKIPEQKEEVVAVATARGTYLFICLVAKPSVSTP